MDSAVSGALQPYGSAMELESQWDFSTTQRIINQFLYHDDNNWGHQPALLSLLTSATEGQPPADVETKLKNMIIESGATNGLKPEVQDREVAVVKLKVKVCNISAKIKNKNVHFFDQIMMV